MKNAAFPLMGRTGMVNNGQRGQSPCGPRATEISARRETERAAFRTFKLLPISTPSSGDSPHVGIFRRHPERIFQWAENRSVPAENNMSERGVRRTVIARKVCGGSQSKDALMVREVLQSVIESLRLRCADPVAKLTEALDAYAMDPGICIPDLLFPLPTHKAELSRRRAGTRRA